MITIELSDTTFEKLVREVLNRKELFGLMRAYSRGKRVGPTARTFEFSPDDALLLGNFLHSRATWKMLALQLLRHSQAAAH